MIKKHVRASETPFFLVSAVQLWFVPVWHDYQRVHAMRRPRKRNPMSTGSMNSDLLNEMRL